jgi:hypothetical protein
MKPIRPHRTLTEPDSTDAPAPKPPTDISRRDEATGEQPRRTRRSLMATLRDLRDKAQERATADAEIIASRFRKPDRARIKRFASTSFAHGELAVQFPMLAYALALKLVHPAQLGAAEAAIAAGESLTRVARAAGVPMWTRALPPLACEDPRGPLPHSANFACRISALLRRRTEAEHDMRGILRMVSHVHDAAGEELALWLAHRMPETSLGTELPAPVRMLVLWYLFSHMEASILGRELIHTPWRDDLSLETAMRAVKNFSRRIELELLIGPEGLADPWFPAAQVMDLEFLPLLTSTQIRNEAKSNGNCVDWYAQRLAINEVRLFSVRDPQGRCLANVEISGSENHPGVPRVAQIKAPRNDPASSYVMGVTDLWLRRQISLLGNPDMRRRKPPVPDARRWHEIMAPLAQSGQLPAWAYQAPSHRDLLQNELEFTMLGCRLHTRGWRFA